MTHAAPTRLLLRAIPAALAVSSLVACNDPAASDTPYTVTPVTTAPLAGTAGSTLADTLVVEVRDAEGRLVPGATVHWSLPQGGSLAVQLADVNDRMTGTADDHGRNYAVWTLGFPEGTQEARVAAGTGEPATFTATASVLHALSVTVGGGGTSGFACAVLTDQRPVCWGDNSSGQLGTGDMVARATPTPVAGLSAVQEIRAAQGYACARDLAGDVWCWGNNGSGQAGPAAAQPIQLTPVRVTGAEGAVSLSVSPSNFSGAFSCAVLAAGGAKCWGFNGQGQLGTGDLVSSSTPRAVVGSAGFRSVASGGARSCALDAAGEAWCWGDAPGGELSPLPTGVYTTPVRPVPGSLYSSLAIMWWAQCGIQVGGTASCWGDGSFYSVGTWLTGSQLTTAPVRPDLHESYAQLATDGEAAMFVRSRYGQGFMWGETCCDVYTIPAALMTPSMRITDLAAAGNEYCVLSETGGVYCGPMSWWVLGTREEKLRGIPDDIGS